MISPILLIVYGFWSYFFADPNERLVLNPVFLSAAIILAMIEYFWRRDRQLPIVDGGTLCALDYPSLYRDTRDLLCQGWP